jgi:hypothetical protein
MARNPLFTAFTMDSAASTVEHTYEHNLTFAIGGRQRATGTGRTREVRLRTLIGDIGAEYTRLLPTSSQALLRKTRLEFEQWVPAGYRIEGGEKKLRATPKIAILAANQDTRSGMYVAYLFAADMNTVTLSLNQGVTEIAGQLGRALARQTLAWQANEIRATLGRHGIADLDTTIDLCSTTALALDYQRANIVARTYRLPDLPGEHTMVTDLRRFIKLYSLALDARGRGGEAGDPLALDARESVGEAGASVAPAEPKELAGTGKPAWAKKVAKLAPNRDGRSRKPATQADHQTQTISRRELLVGITGLFAGLIGPTMLTLDRANAGDKAPPSPASLATLPSPPTSTTPPSRFTIDVSHHDWNTRGGNLDWTAIRDAGIAGMVARATYGDPAGFHYASYHFGDFANGAKAVGIGLRGGYHNLVHGDQASINRQVDWLRRELDAHDANWALLDIERYPELVTANLWPRWDDVRRFDDRWAAVDDRVLVGYLPPWNWRDHLGKPDLRDYRGPLVSSNYPLDKTTDDFRRLYTRCGGDQGPGWAPYGNRVSEGWQFSSRAKVPGAAAHCDINAWRMSFDQLYALLVKKPKPLTPGG